MKLQRRQAHQHTAQTAQTVWLLLAGNAGIARSSRMDSWNMADQHGVSDKKGSVIMCFVRLAGCSSDHPA